MEHAVARVVVVALVPVEALLLEEVAVERLDRRPFRAADAPARLLAHLVESREAAFEVEAPRLLLLADEQRRAREVDPLVRLQDLRRETAPRLRRRKFVSRSHNESDECRVQSDE